MYTITSKEVVAWFAQNTNGKILPNNEKYEWYYAFIGIDGKACVPFIDYAEVYTKDEYKIVTNAE